MTSDHTNPCCVKCLNTADPELCHMEGIGGCPCHTKKILACDRCVSENNGTKTHPTGCNCVCHGHQSEERKCCNVCKNDTKHDECISCSCKGYSSPPEERGWEARFDANWRYGTGAPWAIDYFDKIAPSIKSFITSLIDTIRREEFKRAEAAYDQGVMDGKVEGIRQERERILAALPNLSIKDVYQDKIAANTDIACCNLLLDIRKIINPSLSEPI